MVKSTMVLKIKTSSLQRSFETCCTIFFLFFLPFYRTLNQMNYKRQNIWIGVQGSMKMTKKYRTSFKESSIFKITIGRVTKSHSQWLWKGRSNFYNPPQQRHPLSFLRLLHDRWKHIIGRKELEADKGLKLHVLKRGRLQVFQYDFAVTNSLNSSKASIIHRTSVRTAFHKYKMDDTSQFESSMDAKKIGCKERKRIIIADECIAIRKVQIVQRV